MSQVLGECSILEIDQRPILLSCYINQYYLLLMIRHSTYVYIEVTTFRLDLHSDMST